MFSSNAAASPSPLVPEKVAVPTLFVGTFSQVLGAQSMERKKRSVSRLAIAAALSDHDACTARHCACHGPASIAPRS
jgi:hypothetical protein